MNQRTLIGAGALAAGAFVASRCAAAWRRKIRLAGRAALITGGSRGLGLLIAAELARRGVRVALIARDAAELDEARRWLEVRGFHDVMLIPCDVGDRAAIEDAVRHVVDRRGRLDILVNNAGIIQVGPLEHMSVDDFEEAMAVHFWGPLHAMRAALPAMRQQGGGRIVNISSFGGRVAVPHLAPYVASKFALTGLSDAMRAELSRERIYVTTVAPGLMRTGSHVNIGVKGRHEEEYTWFAFGAGAPLISMGAERAARRIVEAARRGRRSLILTWPARLLVAAEALAPSLVGEVMTWVDAALPAPAGPGGDRVQSGRQSQSRWAPSILTRLGDRAAARHNELG